MFYSGPRHHVFDTKGNWSAFYTRSISSYSHSAISSGRVTSLAEQTLTDCTQPSTTPTHSPTHLPFLLKHCARHTLCSYYAGTASASKNLSSSRSSSAPCSRGVSRAVLTGFSFFACALAKMTSSSSRLRPLGSGKKSQTQGKIAALNTPVGLHVMVSCLLLRTLSPPPDKGAC